MLLSTPEQVKNDYTEHGAEIVLRMPGLLCFVGYLLQTEAAVIDCSACGLRFNGEPGGWRALLPDRILRYDAFINDYQSIRGIGGEGVRRVTCTDLALPYRDLSGLLSSQWAIRARHVSVTLSGRFFPGLPH